MYNVNQAGSSDMYYKGSNILHTLRQLIEDDVLWREILRGMNKEFYHQTVTTEQIENYLSQKTGKDLTAFFNQYLRTKDIPLLEYEIKDKSIKYRYTRTVDDFDMPVRVFVDDQEKWLFPNDQWKTESLGTDSPEIEIDRNFYIRSREIKS